MQILWGVALVASNDLDWPDCSIGAKVIPIGRALSSKFALLHSPSGIGPAVRFCWTYIDLFLRVLKLPSSTEHWRGS